jgi:hypothetical protein
MLDRRTLPLVCLVALFVLVSTSAAAGRAPGESPGHWQPKPTTAPWQWQLQGRIDTGVAAAVYDIDAFEVPASVVRRLHRQGRKVICYLDVGSWENYRPDAAQFPRSVRGRRYEGFPDERWLDIRRFHSFEAPLKRR